ncbi:DUF1456 family protein [Flavobacterium pedocola]
MNNNDVLKKLRVALQLRDDQIVEILELVDFRISKGELGNFFRNEDHPKYMDCGDQVLRNFLNGLVIHLRGTKENPKNPNEVLKGHKAEAAKNVAEKPKAEGPKKEFKKPAPKGKAPVKKEPVVQNVKFKNGKNKKS